MEMNSKEHRASSEIQFSVVSYCVCTHAHTCSAEYLYTIFGSALKNSNIIVHLTPSLLLRSQPNLTSPVAAPSETTQSRLHSSHHQLCHCYLRVSSLSICAVTHRLHCSALSSIGLFLFLCPIASQMELLDTTQLLFQYKECILNIRGGDVLPKAYEHFKTKPSYPISISDEIEHTPTLIILNLGY